MHQNIQLTRIKVDPPTICEHIGGPPVPQFVGFSCYYYYLQTTCAVSLKIESEARKLLGSRLDEAEEVGFEL